MKKPDLNKIKETVLRQVKKIKIPKKASLIFIPGIIALILAVMIFVFAAGKFAIIKKAAVNIPLLKKFIKQEEAALLTQEMPEEEILIKAYKVARRDFDDTMPSLGTIRGYREMNLKFEVSGVMDSLNFREGEEIREGDIIASLDQYDALLKLKYAKIELDNTKKLHEIGSIVKSKLEQAELEYESAKSELDKTYLYAPRDGVMGTRDAEVGEFVTNNDKITTLIDDSDVFVEIGVIERDIGRVKVGQKAKIFVDPYPEVDFKGKVDNVSPVVEGRSRTQSVKIRTNNAKKLLLPGMFARVLTDIYSKENAVVIPNTALNKTEKGYIVFVVHKAESDELEDDLAIDEKALMDGAGESGSVEARPVFFEYRSSDFSVIKEGLEEDELVVVETQEKLQDKMKVIITEVQEQFL